MSVNYEEKLLIGEEYEDYACHVLWDAGIAIINHKSKYYQRLGENRHDIEIKRDGRFRETGNLYIEYAEKSNPNNPEYVDSGILRKDNSWLWVIGDEKTLWPFSKCILLLLLNATKNGMFIYERKETLTSQGMLVPLCKADQYCWKKIDVETEI